MALTSWARLLATIEISLAGEPSALADVHQLRALCDAAEENAFLPLSAEQMTDQRTLALILQLISVVQEAIRSADVEGILSSSNLRASALSDRVGQYLQLGVGRTNSWVGVHYGLWRTGAASPLWVVFPNTAWGQATAARRTIEPWATRMGIATASNDVEYAVALTLLTGVEKDAVTRDLVRQLRDLATVLGAASGASMVPDDI